MGIYLLVRLCCQNGGYVAYIKNYLTLSKGHYGKYVLSDEFGDMRNEYVYVGLRYSCISEHWHLINTGQGECSGNAAWILKKKIFLRRSYAQCGCSKR